MALQEALFPFLKLHLAGLDVGGRLLIDPPPDDEGRLIAIAHDFWEQCLDGHIPNELVIPGVLELWGARFGDQQAKQGMLAKGHQDGFVGGVIDNPLRRLLRVVRAKLGQLPDEDPGLIVLQPPPLLLRSVSLDVISTAIQSHLRDKPAIVAVGLIRWTMQDGRPVEHRQRSAGFTVLTVEDRRDQWKQIALKTNSECVLKNSIQLAHRIF